jgi:signal transduction histidine kinase
MLKTWFEAVPRFFKELKRRKVIKVATVYAIVAGVVAEVGSNTFAALHLPDWALTLVIVLLILGFPIGIVLAWALEITPTGIRAEQELPAPSAPAARTALSSRVLIGRSGPAAQRAARPGIVSAAPAEDDAPAADPGRARRAVVAGLRHDLRTPMNAVLGYGGVLVVEAEELGIVPLVPDIQRERNYWSRSIACCLPVPRPRTSTSTRYGDACTKSCCIRPRRWSSSHSSSSPAPPAPSVRR